MNAHHELAFSKRESVSDETSCLHPLDYPADVGRPLRALRCVVWVAKNDVNIAT